jgi:hypothetical protein
VNDGENEVAQPSCNHDTNFPSGRLVEDDLCSGVLALTQTEPPVEHTTVDGKERSNEVVRSAVVVVCLLLLPKYYMHLP